MSNFERVSKTKLVFKKLVCRIQAGGSRVMISLGYGAVARL